MSTHKTVASKKLLKHFADTYGATAVEPIADGEISQAYFYKTKAGEKILRINKHDKLGFQKDKFAAEHFASKFVPIPPIEEIGELPGGLYYSISPRVAGKTLDRLSSQEIASLMPQIIVTVDAIHHTPPAGDGFGKLDARGRGRYSSWREGFVATLDEPDDYKLTGVSFFEEVLYAKTIERCKELLHFCPEENKLIHGDIGFGNTLAEDGKITAVIDWSDSKYGDPLFDVAWLDFWAPQNGFAKAFKQYYEQRGSMPEQFEERLTCYKLKIAAGSLAFFAKSAQPAKYDVVKAELAKIQA